VREGNLAVVYGEAFERSGSDVGIHAPTLAARHGSAPDGFQRLFAETGGWGREIVASPVSLEDVFDDQLFHQTALCGRGFGRRVLKNFLTSSATPLPVMRLPSETDHL